MYHGRGNDNIYEYLIFVLQLFLVVSWRKDLYYQIWSTQATCLIEFFWITHYTYIRLHNSKNILVLYGLDR